MKPGNGSNPIIVAVEMGYGHLRAAHTIAELFGTEVVRMDLPPVASPGESALWCAIRKLYNGLSQACDWPIVNKAARLILENITHIAPLQSNSLGERATLLAHLADRLSIGIAGGGLRAIAAGKPLLATYPAAAMAARNAHGTRVLCLATDTDLNRAWAPADTANNPIEYLAPVSRVVDRLCSFGVRKSQIHLTGFPLPEKLVEGARSAVARRMHRLDRYGFRRIREILNGDSEAEKQNKSTVAY